MSQVTPKQLVLAFGLEDGFQGRSLRPTGNLDDRGLTILESLLLVFMFHDGAFEDPSVIQLQNERASIKTLSFVLSTMFCVFEGLESRVLIGGNTPTITTR